jgi:hypothetical protein
LACALPISTSTLTVKSNLVASAVLPELVWEVASEELSAAELEDLTEVMVATVWSTLEPSIIKLLAPNTGLSHTSMAKKLGMKEVVALVESMDKTGEAVVVVSSG